MTASSYPDGSARSAAGRQPRALVVMARAARLGSVKTRLAREIGDAEALAVYRELAESVLMSLREVERCVRVLQYTPADAAPELREWAGDEWLLVAQCDGSLGDRMAAAAAERFAEGAERVVIVGTDCPAVNAPLVHDAFAALDDYDVVFGPADDGGYYLVGMRAGPAMAPEPLFARVPWSAPDTLAANVARAAELGLSVGYLPPHHDVDSRRDLDCWRAHRSATRGARDGPLD